jgi:RNA polymerase sigma factor (sigma-70 family)
MERTEDDASIEVPVPTACSPQLAANPIHSLSFGPQHCNLRSRLQRFFAGYRLDVEDSDDLTQEVFLRFIQALRCCEIRDPDAFVFTLARNLVRDRARRLQTRCTKVSISLQEVDLVCGLPQPDEVLEQEERLREAEHALAALRPKTREAFLLRRVQGYEYPDIAALLGVSVSMIEKHMIAATAALRLSGV